MKNIGKAYFMYPSAMNFQKRRKLKDELQDKANPVKNCDIIIKFAS